MQRSIKNRILEIVAKHMDTALKDVSTEESLFNQGVGSLMAVEIVADLEEELDCAIDISALWEFETIDELSLFLESKANIER